MWTTSCKVTPTRRQVNVEQIQLLCEGRDGRLATHHYIRDDLALLDQLGVRAHPPKIASSKPARDSGPTGTKFATMVRFAAS